MADEDQKLDPQIITIRASSISAGAIPGAVVLSRSQTGFVTLAINPEPQQGRSRDHAAELLKDMVAEELLFPGGGFGARQGLSAEGLSFAGVIALSAETRPEPV